MHIDRINDKDKKPYIMYKKFIIVNTDFFNNLIVSINGIRCNVPLICVIFILLYRCLALMSWSLIEYYSFILL